MPQTRPRFLVTIDTEGDDLWAGSRAITTDNARFLPRFQALAETYGLKPTYLVSYEMALSPMFEDFGRDIVARRTGEIGMHLHAWNTPPLEPLTADDFRHRPYLVEYPRRLIEQKVAMMTDVLGERFGPVSSHRAGRWAFDEVYARILSEAGYRVDCSVTSHVSWRGHRGNPAGKGGTDYTRFPTTAYFLDLDDISREGTSALLEMPMTIVPSSAPDLPWLRRTLEGSPRATGALNRLLPAVHWLRPNGRNRETLLRITRNGVRTGRPYLQFMLHSSELMPGGSRRFREGAQIESLYGDLEALFDLARQTCVGSTLQEFHDQIAERRLQCV